MRGSGFKSEPTIGQKFLSRVALTLILIISLVILNEVTYSVTHFVSVIALTLLLTSMFVFTRESKFNIFRNPIVVLFAITFSFFLPISNFVRWSTLGIFAGLLILRQRQDFAEEPSAFLESLNYVLAGNLLLSIFSKFPRFLLQFLSFGYDNALHFSLFRDYRLTASFPFGFTNHWATDFGLFRTYPSGQAAIWSFFAEPLIGNSIDPVQNLVVYASLALICLLGITAILWKLLSRSNGNFLSRLLVPWTFSGLISVGFVGILFTNGFVPYAGGTFILALLVVVYPICVSSVEKVFTLAASLFLLSLTTPSLILFLSLPVLFIGIQELRVLISTRKYLTLITLSTVVLMIFGSILWVSHKTTSSFGWRQILAGGGAQPPNLYEILIVLILFLFILYRLRREITHDILMLVSLSGLLSVGLFAAVTIAYTGSIQYYAVKQCYVWLIFGAVVVCREFVRQSRLNNGAFAALSACLSLVLLLPLVFPKVYSGGFMGTLPNTLIHTLSTESWKTEVVNADVTLSAVSAEKNGDECLILRYTPYDSDLNSRWLNSLTQQVEITNDCFSGFWNATSLTLTQLQDRLSKLNGPFAIVIDSAQAMKIPSEASRKIRYLIIK